MGHSYSNASIAQLKQWERERVERDKQRENEERGARMKLAEKLVMVMIDRINQVVVRPGPDPEERECYDMAQEIRDLTPELATLVSKVLKVDAEEAK